jgi:putative holliday junction resolvase
MRYLAIDLGAKRTGLAVGDDVTGIATPVDVLATASAAERLRLLGRAIEKHGPDALVLGLPLVSGGGGEKTSGAGEPADIIGPAAKAARAFAGELTRQFGLKVYLMDERLSSYAADQQMSRSGLTRQGKKQRRDALAAAVILRDFLEVRKRAKEGTREST